MRIGRAFSLVELMVTIAIIGVLAAVAVPAYRDYITKSKFARGVYYVSECKKQIENFYREYDKYPSKVCGVSKGSTESIDNGSIAQLSYNVSVEGTQKAYMNAAFGTDIVDDADGDLEKTKFYMSVWFDKDTDSFQSECGQFNTSQLPTSYLHLMPASCREENISGGE